MGTLTLLLLLPRVIALRLLVCMIMHLSTALALLHLVIHLNIIKIKRQHHHHPHRHHHRIVHSRPGKVKIFRVANRHLGNQHPEGVGGRLEEGLVLKTGLKHSMMMVRLVTWCCMQEVDLPCHQSPHRHQSLPYLPPPPLCLPRQQCIMISPCNTLHHPILMKVMMQRSL